MRANCDEIAQELGDHGLCIRNDFLSRAEIVSLQSDFDSVYSSGKFHRAAVGNGTTQAVRATVRSDETFWLEPGATDLAQAELLARCDALKTAFNRSLFLGLGEFEGHYATYPAGGFYERHLDSFANDSSRTVSLVIYLNENWNQADGGQLRIYRDQSHIDVEPRAGTMVCFLSRETEHEVLPSRSRRRSFSGWFKRPR